MKSLYDSLHPDENQNSISAEQPTLKSAKAISRKLLESPEYQASLIRRIASDSLPAAVECKLYDYAYGKPVDKVEVKDTTESLEHMTSEQLEARAMALATLARKMREQRGASDDPPSQVH